MSKIIIGDKEQQNIYLYNYYFWQNTASGTLRLFGGPIMVALAIWFYMTDKSNPILFGSVLLVYGLYYALRPFIYVYFNREKLDMGVFEIQVNKSHLTIANNKGSSDYEYTELKKIKRFKDWYVIYFKKNSILVIPSNQLTNEEQELLNHRIV